MQKQQCVGCIHRSSHTGGKEECSSIKYFMKHSHPSFTPCLLYTDGGQLDGLVGQWIIDLTTVFEGH